MEYNWNIKKLYKLRKDLLDLIHNTEGLTEIEKNKQLESLIILKDLIKDCKKNTITKESHPIFLFSSYIPKDIYYKYLLLPIHIRETILECVDCFKDKSFNYSSIHFSKTNLTDDELVAMCYQFYKSLNNDDFLKKFNKYTNPKNHLLRFVSNSKSNNLGETVVFPYPTYTPYISINRKFNINDFITLNHEIAHSIYYKYENSNSYYYFKELEGFFFEYLSKEYLKDKVSNNELKEIEYRNLYIIYELIIDFYITNYTIKATINKDKVIPSIIDKIKRDKIDIDITKKNVKEAILTDPDMIAKYVISYLISLDLIEIYESDKGLAFYLLKKIRTSNSWEIFNEIEKDYGIDFLSDDYHNLVKKIDIFR